MASASGTRIVCGLQLPYRPMGRRQAQDPRFGSVVRRVLWRALSLGRARSWLHLVSLLRGPGNAKVLLASDLTNIERNDGLFHLLSF
jgi:hypothetical protein